MGCDDYRLQEDVMFDIFREFRMRMGGHRPCTGLLILSGKKYQCQGQVDHDGPHRNTAAPAIWSDHHE